MHYTAQLAFLGATALLPCRQEVAAHADEGFCHLIHSIIRPPPVFSHSKLFGRPIKFVLDSRSKGHWATIQQPRRPLAFPWVFAQETEDKGDKPDPSPQEGGKQNDFVPEGDLSVDWDSAWSQFKRTTVSDNPDDVLTQDMPLAEMLPPSSVSRNSEIPDTVPLGLRIPITSRSGSTRSRRSEDNLLDIWANGSFFLVAMAGVGLLLLFYISVFFTDISHKV
eukprot:CAMPEP_0184343508 /NCGR_PEP_ID=MMETSP1089-20130417/12015_1 /TAXON_ID=38269 ORGANISM="Gloeochaete wittrockiana, Strain SAG46.84" /NCGR_SAMPLE_ID=MMETSP1089 /ASSEMBLY_ACC=CAM_ASM_000445 /LENGTH=221 /DNA_ID=CAMNT_0026672821 /DNA_START=80 /DNA_END=745 /DNA_ORIENTATION=-